MRITSQSAEEVLFWVTITTKGSDTPESFLSKVTFERKLARVSLKLLQFFFFRKKLSRLEHVLFLKVSFASYFRKRLSKENLLVCHKLYGSPCAMGYICAYVLSVCR